MLAVCRKGKYKPQLPLKDGGDMKIYAPIAQQAEQDAFNIEVVGSIPAGGTEAP